MSRALLAAAGSALLISITSPAAAQDAATKKKASALFTEGRKLVSKPGSLDEACSKFEQSYALVARGDTLLNLAECHRLQGRTATAWKEFGRSIDAARNVKFDQAVKIAKERHADLEAKLSFLTVTVPLDLSTLKGFEVTLNGYPIPKDAWGRRVPVDPGMFEIAAKAEGRRPFVETRRVGPESDKQEVTVALEPLPIEPPPKPPPPPPKPPRRPDPPKPPPPPPSVPAWAWAAGGGGLAALAASGFFGALALNAQAELVKKCGGDPARCPVSTKVETFPLADKRTLDRQLFIVFSTLGAAGIVVGATGIGLTSARAKASRSKAGFIVAPFGAGVSVRGQL